MRNKYVLKNAGRFTISIFVVLTIIVSMFLASSVYGYKKSTFKVISVASGDTLWDIATKYSNRKDIREYIYEIKQANNLSTSSIRVGSKIKVPIDY